MLDLYKQLVSKYEPFFIWQNITLSGLTLTDMAGLFFQIVSCFAVIVNTCIMVDNHLRKNYLQKSAKEKETEIEQSKENAKPE